MTQLWNCKADQVSNCERKFIFLGATLKLDRNRNLSFGIYFVRTIFSKSPNSCFKSNWIYRWIFADVIVSSLLPQHNNKQNEKICKKTLVSKKSQDISLAWLKRIFSHMWYLASRNLQQQVSTRQVIILGKLHSAKRLYNSKLLCLNLFR